MNCAIDTAATLEGTIGRVYDSFRDLSDEITETDDNFLVHRSDLSDHGSSIVAVGCNVANGHVARAPSATDILLAGSQLQEKREKIATDHQRARTVEEIRGCAALPEYFVYGFRGRSHRSHRTEWFGQIDVAGDAHRCRQVGQWGRGDSQGDAAQLRRADFGIRAGSDDPLGHRESS